MLRYLKKTRVFVSLLLLFLISYIYIDFTHTSNSLLHNVLTSIQLLPAILKITVHFSLYSIGLIFVVVLTLFFGRVYCSSICPLGTLQDFVIYISKKLRDKRQFLYKPGVSAYHYSILGLSIVLFLIGSTFLFSLLDPFSNYGRIANNLFQPAILFLNNLSSSLLGYLKFYFLYNVPIFLPDWKILLFPALLLILVVYMSYYHGRLFCNSLCPVGALLGFASRISIYKIRFDLSACIDCGLCEKVCKANCIDSKEKKLDYERCVVCFNCIDDCPSVGINFSNVLKEKHNSIKNLDTNKRKFIISSFAIFLSGTSATSIASKVLQDSTLNRNKSRFPVTPPGSKSIEHFTSLCTSCYLCVSACPTQVLVPTLMEYGWSGVLQPKMNYAKNFCNYECNICSQVCPSGAILPIELEKKKLIQLGRAKF
ncbi:MAG: 4Fe-4S binding protein, partial [Ignavibacteria bacterium]|nr:4Fe-4S binding protein [Ignavibacteria bacterium]